ncbi:MAG: glycosyltransferase [Chloroflexi bacterium]|jgi:glycosyltransferase involved in cell wall biosynthesis|nr:glycosyltransferase [Anaerolineaceae bacterium]NLI44885.1 glycosyltransferase [Chloroflexota bacterium]
MSESPRIAIIAGQLVVGGAERQLYLWLANLDRQRFEPIVLTLHPGYNDFWEKPIEALGIPLYRIDRSTNRLSRFREILSILKYFNPHLIHGWNLFSGVYAAAAAKLLRARSLCGVRNTYATFARHKLLAVLALWLSDGFVVNSNSAAAELRARLGRRNKAVYVVPNAVDPIQGNREELRRELADRYDLPEQALWAVSIGRMEASKRFDLLLDLTAALREKDANLQLVLFGDGPERQSLERRALEFSLKEKVTFAGEVPQASFWLPAFDLFVFASVDEGLPNVIMEAGAAGLPIAAWKLPFYEEILEDEKTGLLVEAENLPKLVEAVNRLAHSRQLREQLGAAARVHILRNFSLEKYVAAMTAVYTDLLKDSGKRAGAD